MMMPPSLEALIDTDPAVDRIARSQFLFLGTALVLLLSLLLGGGARQGRLTDAVLQVCALPLCLSAFWNARSMEWTKSQKIALTFCVGVVLLPLVQLIPLPPFLWTNLPSRNMSMEIFDILHLPQMWMPLTFSANSTWVSFLSLLPPFAIFLATLQLNASQRKWLGIVLLAGGTIMAFFAVLQVAQGISSPFRIFEYTEQEDAVGFFGNRDHFASFLVVMFVFSASLMVAASRSDIADLDFLRRTLAHKFLLYFGILTLMVLFLCAEILARSRAGLGITIVAIFCLYFLFYRGRNSPTSQSSRRLMAIALTLATGFSLQYALYRALVRFTVDPMQDERFTFYQKTWAAIQDFFPAGSGMGTFMAVYPLYEGPAEVAMDLVTNRAHNDVLELLLEGGLLTLLLMIGFALWFMIRSYKIWRSENAENSQGEKLLAMAASISILVLFLHSLVDFPLRTSCLLVVFAFCSALLVDAPESEETMHVTTLEQITKFNLQQKRKTPVQKPLRSSQAQPLSPQKGQQKPQDKNQSHVPSQQRWGVDLDWPEEWKNSSESKVSKEKTKKDNDKDIEKW